MTHFLLINKENEINKINAGDFRGGNIFLRVDTTLGPIRGKFEFYVIEAH